MTPEEQLLVCLKTESPEAWRELLEALTPVVWRVTWRLIGPARGAAAVEDVSQEAFLRLLRHDRQLLRRFDPTRSSLLYYVALVARSCALDQLKSPDALSQAVPLDFCPPVLELVAPEPPTPADDWRLEAALASLGRQERAVIEAAYREELSSAEIAAKLDLAEATVRSTKRNALKKLRDFFA